MRKINYLFAILPTITGSVVSDSGWQAIDQDTQYRRVGDTVELIHFEYCESSFYLRTALRQLGLEIDKRKMPEKPGVIGVCNLEHVSVPVKELKK